MVGELPDGGAAGGADGHRREELGLQQPDDEPDATAPAEAVTTHVIARADDAHVAVLVMLDEDHPLDLDLARLDERGDGVEVALGGIEILVGANEDVMRRMAHLRSFRVGWRGSCILRDGSLTGITLLG